MVIAIYGAGYVGLVSAACYAKIGHQVVCVDVDKKRIAALIKGECPIYEEALPQLLNEQMACGRLQFTDDLTYAIKQATVHVIATGTPSARDGHADLSQVFAVATTLAREVTHNGLLVVKSTVPVGTGDAIEQLVSAELVRGKKAYRIDVVSNPEFLREGSAVHDFLHADRIIIGGEREPLDLLQALYQPLVEQGVPILAMSRHSAELAKYAANAMLACRVSFMNQLSRIAEKVDANIDEVRQGIGLDHRIGPHFLQAGIGYGGSCFPKDVRALIQAAQLMGVDVPLLEAIEKVNYLQKNWVVEQLNSHFNHELQNKVMGLWGISFKPDTDDIREASSLVTIQALLEAGVQLRLYDPVAMSALQALLPENKAITWCASADDVLSGGLDALIIATEWQQFKDYDLSSLHAALKHAAIIDGRNCFGLREVERAGMAYYYSVGRPKVGMGFVEQKG